MLSPVTTSASAEPMALPRYRNSSDEIDPNIISAGSQASQYGALSNTKRCQYEALYGRLRRPRDGAAEYTPIWPAPSPSRANQPHTRLATSATSLSLRSCIAGSTGLPLIPEAKPH